MAYEISDEMSQKRLPDKEIQERLREIRVKGYLTGDTEKYLSDKAEFPVEEAISKIMFCKPGLLKRGLKCEETYGHLKDFLGDISLNCFEANCSQHKSECYQMEADIIFRCDSISRFGV